MPSFFTHKVQKLLFFKKPHWEKSIGSYLLLVIDLLILSTVLEVKIPWKSITYTLVMNLLSFSTVIIRDSIFVLTLCGIVNIPQSILQLSKTRKIIEASLLQLLSALLSASKMLMRVLCLPLELMGLVSDLYITSV